MIYLLSVAVFIAAGVLDYATVRYQRAVAAEARHRAAIWSVTMYAISAVGFLSVVSVSPWLMIPECLGLYAGTLIAMRHPAAGTPSA